ncbi:DUF4177 domain-containing protein [Coralloluteibacterium thermophilus]|uniref:DUF4177 domain-containing protein n=1 Tax=Coralloluteibacterium thermophilum TaxID=2707049 RepID=A0ABV9NI72_9GAMM
MNDRWEYKVLAPRNRWGMGETKPDRLAELLNREGAQGWELVSSVWMGAALKFFLKRRR